MKALAYLATMAFAAKAIVALAEYFLLWWLLKRLGIRWEIFLLALLVKWWFAPRKADAE